jgi:hypothetical protein
MPDESIFDADKNYYIFKYVVDKVSGEPTEHEGEIQAFVKGSNSWDACERAGFDDMNVYGANQIDNLADYEKAIADERKHLTKISKQLKEMTTERDEEMKKYMEERPCPNGCGQLDDKFKCGNCGYGHEEKELLKDLDKTIKEEKKKGNDTSQLEKIRDVIKSQQDNDD